MRFIFRVIFGALIALGVGFLVFALLHPELGPIVIGNIRIDAEHMKYLYLVYGLALVISGIIGIPKKPKTEQK